MIDEAAMNKINELSEQYKERWGKEVDLIGMPNNTDQTKMVRILERIVDTGESIIVGYDKTYGK